MVADAARDAKSLIPVPISAASGKLAARGRPRDMRSQNSCFAVCVVSWTILHWQVLASKSAPGWMSRDAVP